MSKLRSEENAPIDRLLASSSARSESSSNRAQSDVPESSPVNKRSPSDFVFGKQIGEGSFATVYIATDAESRTKEFAIKMCEKALIRKEKKQEAILREKEIMNILNQHTSPYFIKLFCTFQDANRLFFVMNYAKGGELLSYINKAGCFNEECTRFYATELLLALEHLHSLGIVHRDLKPENILLTEQLHIQVTDFGSALVDKTIACSGNQRNSSGSGSTGDGRNSSNNFDQSRRSSFVGTAQYVSPELLTDKRASKASDLWAFGCIIYQMVSGIPPFQGANEYIIFQKILKLDFDYPSNISKPVKNIIEKLLKLNPCERLGYRNTNQRTYTEIREDPFFEAMQSRWLTLHTETPPRVVSAIPESSTTSVDSNTPSYEVPHDLEPGLDERQMTRLLGLALYDDEPQSSVMGDKLEFSSRIAKQARESQWHRFVEGNLILKHGFIDKRKGLFFIARRRMFLFTTGPRVYYVDPVNMVLKGEIPWSETLRPEAKNFKTFYVHTPNRTYYLEDPNGDAPGWCKFINDMLRATSSAPSPTTNASSNSGPGAYSLGSPRDNAANSLFFNPRTTSS